MKEIILVALGIALGFLTPGIQPPQLCSWSGAPASVDEEENHPPVGLVFDIGRHGRGALVRFQIVPSVSFEGEVWGYQEGFWDDFQLKPYSLIVIKTKWDRFL